MIKKLLGILFFVVALLILIGSIANDTLFNDLGSAAATFGNFLGKLIPIVLYIFSGIFLFAFDNPIKMNYIDGFKKRSKQVNAILPLLLAYFVLFLISCYGLGLSGVDNYVLGFITVLLPYLVPIIVFAIMLPMYALTHNTSKKYFANSDAALNQYLSANETFYAWSEDHSVLASQTVLYFPQLFCVIPFNQIASTKLYKQLGEQGIYINLSNGKKIYVATKHSERVEEAINAKR